MKQLHFLFTLFLVFVFILGIYVYSSGKLDKLFHMSLEGMDNAQEGPIDQGANCPDLLIRQGNNVLLYNTRIPVVKDMNPIVFSNLDEYITFRKNEKTKGINCPVLFLQHETDIQGKDVYRIRPNIFDTQPGLPTQSADQLARQNGVAPVIDSNTDHPPYNAGQYAGFDPLGLSVGVYTKLDQVHDSTVNQDGQSLSDNPMDPNWGGVLYTQQKIQSGKYEENEVYKPNLLTIRNTQFHAGQFGQASPPNQLITYPH